MGYKHFHRRLATLVLVSSTLLLLAGCSTIDNYDDPRDPLERYNRFMYSVNDTLDNTLITPLAKGYKAVLPTPVNRGITNVFNNLVDLTSVLNNVLQFKFNHAVSGLGRVLVNTTIGVGGLVDIASEQDLPRYREDFGQTLGSWGAGPGPYIVLPLLGSSDVRDTFGLVVDWYVDPVRQVDPEKTRWAISGLRGIDKRADLLSASKIMEEAALDKYEFHRDAYLQKRRSDIYDGDPPLEEEME
ncbi:VacJ family lipoprotein [Pseudomonadota bacterium]